MKTLLFCTTDVRNQSAWQQRYLRWLNQHRASALSPDAIVMIDDHSPFQPPFFALLRADRIGLDALPAEAMLRFGQRLGRPGSTAPESWYRALFASLNLALRYGFERIIHVESDSFMVSQRLSQYMLERSTGWTALRDPQASSAHGVIQVICRDAFQLIEELASKGPFAFRDQSAELTLPYTALEQQFTGEHRHQFDDASAANADYLVYENFTGMQLSSSTLASIVAKPSIEPLDLPHASDNQAPPSSDQDQLRQLCLSFPYDAELACRYGIAAYQNGNFEAARSALERADWIRPEHGLTCKFLGATRMQQGEVAGAVFAAAQSAQLNSEDVDAQNMAGAFNLQAGHLLAAIKYFRAALALEPEASSTRANLAQVDWADATVRAQYPEGMRGIEREVRTALLERLRANRLTTRGAAALLAFGVHFREGFDLLVQLASALMADPSSDAQTLFMAGNVLIVSGDRQAALTAYQHAALLAPQSDRIKAAVGYASICQGGDLFGEGFKLANLSWPHINPAAFAASPERWRGETASSKRLLVYQEQGIGDALICLRFLPLLHDRGIEAALWLRPELTALVAEQTGVPLVKSDQRPDAAQLGFDSVTPLFGLIDALNIAPDKIPPPLTIKAPSASVRSFADQLASLKQLRVGLCLFGNPNRSDDWARSVRDTEIAVLAQLQDVDWINLSVDARPERQSLQRMLPELTDLATEMPDFEASAALIANLDVVISIDSVVAHLAAALGKPVLLLCPTIADWRWAIGQVQSPWWPSVEVFTSQHPGEFGRAMLAIAARISALAAAHRLAARSG